MQFHPVRLIRFLVHHRAFGAVMGAAGGSHLWRAERIERSEAGEQTDCQQKRNEFETESHTRTNAMNCTTCPQWEGLDEGARSRASG